MENKEFESSGKDLVSIVLTNYNKEKFIGSLLDSLIRQTYKNWELIIMDDCSTDGSVGVVQKFIAENKGKKIVFVRNEKNVGLMKNFEKGLQFAAGEYIAVCDSDDVWLPNKLENELRLLKKGNFGMVYSDLTVVDENLKLIKKSFRKSHLSFFSNPKDDSFDELINDNHITAPTILFKSKLKEKLIPFSEYVMQDYWIAIIFSIFSSIGYLDETTVLYRQHAENMIGAGQFSVSGLMSGKNKISLIHHLRMKKNGLLFLGDLSEVGGIGEQFLEKIKSKKKKLSVLVDCLSRLEQNKGGFWRCIPDLWGLKAYREILQVAYFKIFS